MIKKRLLIIFLVVVIFCVSVYLGIRLFYIHNTIKDLHGRVYVDIYQDTNADVNYSSLIYDFDKKNCSLFSIEGYHNAHCIIIDDNMDLYCLAVQNRTNESVILKMNTDKEVLAVYTLNEEPKDLFLGMTGVFYTVVNDSAVHVYFLLFSTGQSHEIQTIDYDNLVPSVISTLQVQNQYLLAVNDSIIFPMKEPSAADGIQWYQLDIHTNEYIPLWDGFIIPITLNSKNSITVYNICNDEISSYNLMDRTFSEMQPVHLPQKDITTTAFETISQDGALLLMLYRHESEIGPDNLLMLIDTLTGITTRLNEVFDQPNNYLLKTVTEMPFEEYDYMPAFIVRLYWIDN